MLFTSGFTPAVANALGVYPRVGGETAAMLISAHCDSIQMKETRRAPMSELERFTHVAFG